MNESAKPYHTGTYLIFDNNPERPAKDGNFRSGLGLDPPLRASGSHQLDVGMLAGVIDRIANGGAEVRRVLIVDLRRESHAFVNDRAVSWCADRDWANVGYSPAWIARDEQCELEKLATAPETNIFTISKGAEGEIQVVGATPLHVTRAETEEMVVERLRSRFEVSYCRLHVTDHCAPEGETLRMFLQLLGNVAPTTWVHFRRRQLRLFHYDVRPDPTSKRWQMPLSEARWRLLESFRQYVFGGYGAGQPWPGPGT